MLSHSNIEDIVGDWIVYTTKHRMNEKKKELWLLYDFLEEDLTETFYVNNYRRAKAALEKLDTDKENVKEICDYLHEIIEKYSSRGVSNAD